MLFNILCPVCLRSLLKVKRYSKWREYKKLLPSSSSTVLVLPRYSSSKVSSKKQSTIDTSEYPTELIRNFSIIAHVDHGKSTLADRLLEHTGTISSEFKNEQVLDKLQVERERGITVKAQTASLFYRHNDKKYLLNLIDTPGHVDFNYEVSRSLAACQGVILLVDANQGVQAQTVANFYLAFERDLVIIPVLNKIDLKAARPDEVIEQLQTVFDMEPHDVLKVSAKLGTGIEEVLQAVIEKIPPPKADRDSTLKAFVFDSWYDKFRGAVCNVAVLDGYLQKGQVIQSHFTGKTYGVTEVGIMYPDESATSCLYAGQVGYMYANIKTTKDVQVGDTLFLQTHPVKGMPGFEPARPMVYAGVYPMDQSEQGALRTAIDKLTLNDSSVAVHRDSSVALGQGWRLGFLGLLHMDVFCQRLEQEHDTSVIITSPNVPYRVKITGAKLIKDHKGDLITIYNPSQLPDSHNVLQYEEPMVLSTIIAPDNYMGDLISLIMERRGEVKNQTYIDNKRIMYKVIFPLNEIIVDFFDALKSITSGYASFDYEDHGYQESMLIKVDMFLNGQQVEELSHICHVSKARKTARHITDRLKEAIPRQMYEIAIQAKVGGKVICRENIKALRKDVTAKCYGGDITRKMKLLKRQAEGKKKMRRIGNVEIPKEAFTSILKK